MFDRHVIGVDVDDDSLEIAAINAEELEVIPTLSDPIFVLAQKLLISQ